MPRFGVHMTASGFIGLSGAWMGLAHYGWGPPQAALAAMAGLAGGLVPDLDADRSRPTRFAAFLVGLVAALGVVQYLLHRNRPLGEGILAGLVVLAAAPTAGAMLLRGFTIHRGMFHSLPMALMYGSGTALVFGSLGKNAALAVGLVAGAGVLSHLVLDAAAGFTLGPLKLCSRRIGPSLAAWFFALLLTALAWSRAA